MNLSIQWKIKLIEKKHTHTSWKHFLFVPVTYVFWRLKNDCGRSARISAWNHFIWCRKQTIGQGMKNWLKIKNLQNLSIDGENNGQYRSFSMTLCLCSTWKYLEKKWENNCKYFNLLYPKKKSFSHEISFDFQVV